VGDLDGDGRSDALFVNVIDNAMTVHALRGDDGHVLWSRVDPADDGYAYPAAVGAGGDPGVIMAKYRTWSVLSQSVTTLQVVALSGTGQVVWESTRTGICAGALALVAGGGRCQGLPYLAGFLHANPSPATDVLVGLRDVTYTMICPVFACYVTFVDTVTGQIVRGTDGSAGAQATTVGFPNHSVSALPGPDVNGDGLDDFVLEEGNPFGISGSRVAAYDGSDGDSLWETTDLAAGGFAVLDGGRVTGSPGHDLVVSSRGFVDTELNPLAHLLRATDGGVVWSKAVGLPNRLGDLDGDGKDEIGFATFEATPCTVENCPPDDQSYVGVRFEAINDAGSDVYSVSYRATGSMQHRTVYVTAGGDVEPDGVPDATYRITGGSSVLDGGVVSGRTGEKLWSGDPGYPVAAPVDGSGDDLVSATGGFGSPSVYTAQDGLTGAAIWLQSLGPTFTRPGVTQAADLDGDGRADVIVSLDVGTFDWVQPKAWVLRGTDGTVLWTI
jgi:hypothetical protein